MKKKMSLFLLISVVLISFTACKSGASERESSTETNSAKKTENVPVGLNIGERAPDMEFPSPEGELLKLSSLRGKVVLIDFWAGWCPPCRMENPNIVATWQKYKNETFRNGNGFTVYGVSLDNDKKMWLDAIEKDKLAWEYHVSDLKGWKSVPAAMYQVRGIPASWLIDGDGIIVAKNLRGPALAEALDALR